MVLQWLLTCIEIQHLGLVWFMVFNVTFNNISVILRWSVLLMEETRVPGENHRPAAIHRQTLSHNVLSSRSRLSGVQTHNFSGDSNWLYRYKCSCKSNHHTIMTTTPPMKTNAVVEILSHHKVGCLKNWLNNLLVWQLICSSLYQ